jgi:hypothetical protein
VRPLAPSPAWTLVTPYCKRTRPGRGTNTKDAGFPPLSRPSLAAFFSPFALGLAPTHLGWGTRRHFTRRPRDPSVSKRRQYLFSINKIFVSDLRVLRTLFAYCRASFARCLCAVVRSRVLFRVSCVLSACDIKSFAYNHSCQLISYLFSYPRLK